MMIEIDFEVYKKLTSMRRHEGDSYNEVLRRALKLPARQAGSASVSIRYWDCRGGRVCIGMRLQARYHGKTYHAAVTDHGIEYEGQCYGSPSEAAAAVTKTNVNGWRFWQCQLRGEPHWRYLSELRRRD